MTSSINVTFWGVRGSYPAPGPRTARIGGNTSCVEVRIGNHLIILDAGTGIIGLGHAMMEHQRLDDKPICATLLFSHTHHDHTQGFPFFNPIYSSSTTLYVFGPKTLSDDLELVLSRAMLPPVFPVNFNNLPCMRVMRNLNEGEVIVLNSLTSEPLILTENRDFVPTSPNNVVIRTMRSAAHPHGVFVYRIEHENKSVVYATDVEGYAGGDQRLIRFARGASLLIHDSQYTEAEYTHATLPKQGWGHSTWQMAVGIAQAAQVGKLAMFHHEPDHDDEIVEQIGKEAQALFPATVVAREGLCIEI